MIARNRPRLSPSRWLRALLASSALLCAAPVLAQTITAAGDVTPAPASPQPSPWDITGNLTVGNTADGTLAIAGVGVVSNAIGYIGYNAGVTGTVTVDGSGSQWNNTGALYAGNSGTGTLQITGGGIATSSSGEIAYNAGSSGAVTVSGTDSKWTNSGSLDVGRSGDATLEISAGGVVSNTTSSVGFNGGSTGTVTVSGAGSQWNNSSTLTVGNAGTGTLKITNAGVVSNVLGYIGNSASGVGTVTVDGPGSKWNSTSTVGVGNIGTGTLEVTAGGVVSSAAGNIGVAANSTGAATVDGQRSQWIDSGIMVVGNAGTGTLQITNAGFVSNQIGYIGYNTTGAGTVMVDGSGSQWDNSGELYVGRAGTGTLEITNAGVVSNTIGYVGYTSTGMVTVDGQGSQWNNTSSVFVGQDGSGTLEITNGGFVSNAFGFVANSTGSTGAVTVTGVGSQWTNSSDLFVGRAGDGTLVISGGGVVSNATGTIGYASSSTSTVTVDGSGSQWNNAGALIVGDSGTGTLTISGGGAVSSTFGGIIGNAVGSTGTVTVDGPGSRWSNGGVLYVGDQGAGTLVISNGGVVSNTEGGIGYHTNGTGAVTVTGNGSQWNNAGVLHVNNGTLNITDGGVVSSTGGIVANAVPPVPPPLPPRQISAGANLAMVTVSGAGSQWNNTGDLSVGYDGTGILTIANAGFVSAATGTVLAGDAGSTGTLNIGAAAGQAATAPGTLTTPTVTFGEGTAGIVFNHTDMSGNYVFAPVITGGSVTTSSVEVLAGITVMTGVGSDYFGHTTVYDGAVLAAGAANVFSPNSDYFLQDPGTLNLNGFNQTVGSLTNAGLAIMGTGTTPGAILTVNGNYVGDGGIIVFNTVLGADNSLTDKMVVNGTTSGQTGVTVINAGGLGALTTGNGIELVHVTNGIAASNGTFSLTGRVAAGAYSYDLFQNGLNNADGNWYLRSEMRSEVPPDVDVPVEASRLGLAMLGSAANRLGGYGPEQFCADEVVPNFGMYTKARPTSAQCNTLLWGRVFGETGSAGVGANGGFGSAGPTHSFDYGGFEAGADLHRTARDTAGLYAGAATSRSDVNMPTGGAAGSLGLNAYAFGGYWTHRASAGWYTDLVLQGDWYDNIRARSVEGQVLATQGWGITASAEAGYQLTLGNGFSVIPQGQLIYQRTSIDGGADQFGRISYGATDEIYGRLGTRLAKDWLTDDGRTVATWAETNFWHQFGGDAKTTFTTLENTNPTTFATSLGGTWAQIRLGLSGQLTRNVSIFGNADYNIALDDHDQHGNGHSVGGRAGVKVGW